MKSKVIYVDFVSKNVGTNPNEILIKKSPLASIWERFKKAFTFYDEPSKTKDQSYNYKHMM